MPDQNNSPIFFSLVIPALPDRDKFNVHIDSVCGVLDDKIPGCYEIVAIESRQDDSSLNDWDHVKGEVLVIVDGSLEHSPTTLLDVIKAFEEGNDMAFAGQYIKSRGAKSEPDLSYFGIKRSSLSRLHESPEGQRLILEILGPETIKKLNSSPENASENYILKNLKKIVGVKK